MLTSLATCKMRNSLFTCLETKGRVRPGQYGFLDCSPTSTDGCLKCDCAMGKSTLQKCSSPEAAGVPPKDARKSSAPHGRGGRCASFTMRCSVRPDHPLPSHNPASRSLGALALPPPVIRGARVTRHWRTMLHPVSAFCHSPCCSFTQRHGSHQFAHMAAPTAGHPVLL